MLWEMLLGLSYSARRIASSYFGLHEWYIEQTREKRRYAHTHCPPNINRDNGSIANCLLLSHAHTSSSRLYPGSGVALRFG